MLPLIIKYLKILSFISASSVNETSEVQETSITPDVLNDIMTIAVIIGLGFLIIVAVIWNISRRRIKEDKRDESLFRTYLKSAPQKKTEKDTISKIAVGAYRDTPLPNSLKQPPTSYSETKAKNLALSNIDPILLNYIDIGNVKYEIKEEKEKKLLIFADGRKAIEVNPEAKLEELMELLKEYDYLFLKDKTLGYIGIMKIKEFIKK